MSDSPSLDITNLTIAQVATVLSRSAKRRITAEMVESDIADGLPVKKVDGIVRINLIEYAAWINMESKNAAD